MGLFDAAFENLLLTIWRQQKSASFMCHLPCYWSTWWQQHLMSFAVHTYTHFSTSGFTFFSFHIHVCCLIVFHIFDAISLHFISSFQRMNRLPNEWQMPTIMRILRNQSTSLLQFLHTRFASFFYFETMQQYLKCE